MTLEERKTKARKEILALLDLYDEEEERIMAELKRSGKLTPGLDGNLESFAPLNEEFRKRMKAIFTKYDLPPDAKLKLW